MLKTSLNGQGYVKDEKRESKKSTIVVVSSLISFKDPTSSGSE